MTPKEALKVIDKVHDYPCPYGISDTVWLFIRNCIKKQIHKKPKNIMELKNKKCGYCPNCNGTVQVSKSFLKNIKGDCCSWCGQRLDWSNKK